MFNLRFCAVQSCSNHLRIKLMTGGSMKTNKTFECRGPKSLKKNYKIKILVWFWMSENQLRVEPVLRKNQSEKGAGVNRFHRFADFLRQKLPPVIIRRNTQETSSIRAISDKRPLSYFFNIVKNVLQPLGPDFKSFRINA